MPRYSSEEDYIAAQEAANAPATSDKDYGPPTNSAQLNTVRGMGAGQQFIDTAAHGLNRTTDALKQAWAKISPFSTKQDVEDLQKEMDNNERIYNEIYRSKWNPHRGTAAAGNLVGSILHPLSMATMPFGGAETFPARVAKNAALGGGYEGLTTPGGIGDRLQGAALGTVGAGGGTVGVEGIGRAGSAALGKWKDPAIKAMNDKLVAMGLRPRVGDLAPQTQANPIRWGENLLANTFGSDAFSRQVEKIRRSVVPNPVQRTNVVAKAIEDTNKGVDLRSADIWQPFEQAISGNVTRVKPKGLHDALQPILRDYPQVFSATAIPNKSTRDELLRIASEDPKKLMSIPIQEYHDLRKAIGRAQASVQKLATPTAAGSPAPLTGEAVGLFKQAYKGASEDINRWGKNGSNQKAYKEFEASNAKWEEEVLPWRQSQVAQDLGKIDKLGAPETASVIANADTDAVNQVRDYVRKYGNYDSVDPIDALATMKRHTAELASERPSSKEAHQSIISTLLHPVVGTTTAPLALASGNSVGKGMYFADPSWLMPSQDMSILKALGGMGIATGRESGAPIGTGILALKNLIGGSDNTSSEDTPMGQLNQMGTRGANPIEP